MKRSQYKPRKILFIVNTLDKHRAKELGKITGGDEYNGREVEVFHGCNTRQECFNFMHNCGYGDVYNLYYMGKLFETEEEPLCPKCRRKVIPSETKGYTRQCLHCDEDFYSIEL